MVALKPFFKPIFSLVLVNLVNQAVYSASKDSLRFKPSLYITTRPITDAFLAPNVQVGFRTSDFNNNSRNQYLQLGLTYGNYALYLPRRPFYTYSGDDLTHYSAELDYRFMLKKNTFWSPHFQLSYFQANYDRFFSFPDKVTGLMYEVGFQNGRIYHKPGKSMMNSINWGVGVLYHQWKSSDALNQIQYKALMVYLNWQFGFKSLN